jgi:3-(3-hydroxy-phenyl)propionate hydroxylase
MPESEKVYDVAISGFGPTGATLAGLLAMFGRSVLVVEQETEVYTLPRAVHFDHEVMRTFQNLGIAEAVLPHTRIVPGCKFWTADRELLFWASLDQGTTDQGWNSDYMFHQPTLERLLRDSTAARPEVEVRYAALESYVEDADGVSIETKAPDGSRGRARARHIVGCDGAASPVRKQAGFELADLGFDEPWVVVDLRGAEGLPDFCVQLCDPARPTTLVPGARGFYRFEFMLLPEEESVDMTTPARIEALLEPWLSPDQVDIVRAAVYRFHAVVARDWTRGHVSIAGDAAHQTPPFLGQGMCAGIRDAANLAWKLDLVLRGDAGPKLLETYGQERAPHVEALIQTAVDVGRIICTQDVEMAKQRDAGILARDDRAAPIPPFPILQHGLLLEGSARAGALGLQSKIAIGDSEPQMLDDVLGARFVLVTKASVDAPLSSRAEQVRDRIDCAVLVAGSPSDVSHAYLEWLERHGVDAIMLRPDHAVFGSASGNAAASTLLEALGDGLEH